MLREIDGVRINVLDEGSGPAILFLHGLGGCWRDWEPQLDSLTDRYRCVVVEHRGHGRSQRAPGPYSTDLFAADALAVCRHLGIDHAYVVGLSMGGMIAQKLALAAPGFVDALVLCDTFTHTGRRGVEALRLAAGAVRAEGFGALRRIMPPDTTGWSAHTVENAPHIARTNLRESESNDPDCWAWAVGALVEHDTRHQIGDIVAPSLVVWGAEDLGVPVTLAQPLADALGGAPVVVLDDAGHVCNLEQPAAFDRAITDLRGPPALASVGWMSAQATDAGPMNELGFYALAGQPRSPRDLIGEVRAGEAMGLGSAFVSERWNVKEAATLSGAVGATSERLGIATAATNHNTRHPVVTASYATTMHRLTGGRFTLGLGRGIEPLFDAFGIPRITSAQIEDFVGLARRLWRGEAIFGHDGPAGSYPVLHLDSSFDEHIPVGLTAFGPHSLALAGRLLDMVVLHTFFTDETTARAVTTVRAAAEQAGRDPASVRIWSCFATVGDHLGPDLVLKKTVGRMGSYLQGYGDLMVRTNAWDPGVLERFRADAVVQSVGGSIDAVATTEQLEHIATLIPDEWLAPSARGSAKACAAAVLAQFDLGVDGVIMHGASPDELAPVVAAYRAHRPGRRFDHLAANPGITAPVA